MVVFLFKKQVFSGSTKCNFYWISFFWFVFYSISVKIKSTHLQKHVWVQTVSAGNSCSSGENCDWRNKVGHILSTSAEGWAITWIQETSGCFGAVRPFMSTQTGQPASWQELRYGDVGFFPMVQVNTKVLCWERGHPCKCMWEVTWS